MPFRAFEVLWIVIGNIHTLLAWVFTIGVCLCCPLTGKMLILSRLDFLNLNCRECKVNANTVRKRQNQRSACQTGVVRVFQCINESRGSQWEPHSYSFPLALLACTQGGSQSGRDLIEMNHLPPCRSSGGQTQCDRDKTEPQLHIKGTDRAAGFVAVSYQRWGRSLAAAHNINNWLNKLLTESLTLSLLYLSMWRQFIPGGFCLTA